MDLAVAQTNSAFLLYLPVLQQGYLDWFDAYPDVGRIYIVDDSIISKLSQLRKDVRALSTERAAEVVRALERFREVHVIGLDELQSLPEATLLMPDDDVTTFLETTDHITARIEKYPVFLRWNRNNVRTEQAVKDDSTVSYDDIPKQVRTLLESEAAKSTDWWRRIGAVLVDQDEVILTSFNAHLPTQYTPYIDGDMRMSLNRGDGIELIGSEHAEASALAGAASQGIKTKGMDMYVSAFPCPPCAKFIAHAGIRTVYYEEGYAMGNGMESLELFGTKVVRIIDLPKRSKSAADRPYPEKHT